MKPQIVRITQLSPDQSVVYILGKDEIPENLMLSKSEKEYVLKRIAEKEEYTVVNSYYKNTYIVRASENKEYYRIIEDIRKNAASLKKIIRSNNHRELAVCSDRLIKGAVEAFAEGFILASYSFEKYRTKREEKEKKNYPQKLLLLTDSDDGELKWLTDLTDAVYMARDLINEPVNHLNAPSLAGEIKKMGDAAGFSVDVLNKGKIEALKMGGLLAVNKGSIDPPVFCVLEWKPDNAVNKHPLVLVGKGVVYDTGGLNIKTGEHMENMKGDMAGAAAVAGVLYSIAKSGLPFHLVGLVPATDNRPGQNAYTQGDIITMYNKMTVEIGNTDAEGRMILADALSYAAKFKPELIINIATLTGSAAVTFSNLAIAVMGNADRNHFNLLEECGREVYERTAELPFWDEYGDMIKSDIADIRNVGGREAGAITAGKFLENFTESPLIHLDIAGTGLLKKDDYYRIKDGPGSGLRLLATFVRRYAEKLMNNK